MAEQIRITREEALGRAITALLQVAAAPAPTDAITAYALVAQAWATVATAMQSGQVLTADRDAVQPVKWNHP